MFIDYGISDDGELIHIEQVQRGITHLKCPYCGGPLLARKGNVKAHHFAHAGETCYQAKRGDDVIALPAYDNFNLHLPGRVVKELHEFARDPKDGACDEDYLERYEVVKFNDWRGYGGGYELTKKGKLVLGQLSLDLFNRFQEPLILERHTQLSDQAEGVYKKPQIEAEIARLRQELDKPFEQRIGQKDASEIYKKLSAFQSALITNPVDLATALVDLRLYRAMWRRILTCSLYFLSVNDGQYYKIGVTIRPIEQRINEIATDLLPHIGPVQLNVLGVWPHRGNVELYFKHRYKLQNTKIGNLTEYYSFEDVTPILRDLRRMKAKTLSNLEQAVLSGEPSGVEQMIFYDQVEGKRRRNISATMRRRAAKGKAIGRPHESTEDLLSKPSSQMILASLEQGMSLRETAKAAEVAVNTVRKVRAAAEKRS